MSPTLPPPRQSAVWSLLAFLLLAGLIAGLGWFYLQRQASDYRTSIGDQLVAVADLKAGQILNWRAAQLSDARALATNPLIAEAMQRCFQTESAGDLARVAGWLQSLREQSQAIRVLLVDSDCQVRVAWPTGQDQFGPSARTNAIEARNTGRVVMSDFHRSRFSDPIHLDLDIPVPMPGAPVGSPPVGIIVIEIDPRRSLYPIMASWPTPSPSAETLLARREGSEVVYLSELRHEKIGVLSLRIPLARTEVLAVQAARGAEGLIEGADYRGVRSLGVVRHIPETDWLLITKIDRSEVEEAALRRGRPSRLTLAALIAAVGLGAGWWWHRCEARRLQAEAAREREHKLTAERLLQINRQADESLKRERNLLHAIIDNLPGPMNFKDTQGRYVLNNQAHLRSMGLTTQEQVLGKTAFEFHPPEQARQYCKDDTEIIRTGVPLAPKEEQVFYPETREYRWHLTSKLPLKDAQGGVLGVLTICHDITARKKAEQERAALQIELQQAQKMESIGLLAAGIAHEINTPTQYIGDNVHFLQKAFVDLDRLLETYARLVARIKENGTALAGMAAILQPVECLRVDFLRREIPRAITDAMEGVDRVTDIVRAMKDFSLLGAQEKHAVDLNHAIASTLTVSRNAWKYVADMVTEFDPDLPSVPCLPGEFNQIILNLVVNAAHAIADVVTDGTKAKGTITVSTRAKDSFVEVSVSDTGSGIPEGIRSRIFEPYFTTKEVGKGSGQGLALARSVIVERHGGTIDFASETGRGTTFTIRLPLHPAAPPEEVTPHEIQTVDR